MRHGQRNIKLLTPMFEVEQESADVGCNLTRLVAGYFSSFVRG